MEPFDVDTMGDAETLSGKSSRLDLESGYRFVDEIKSGAIPREFIPVRATRASPSMLDKGRLIERAGRAASRVDHQRRRQRISVDSSDLGVPGRSPRRVGVQAYRQGPSPCICSSR